MHENHCPIPNVEKALEVLEKLAESREPLSLPTLAESVDFGDRKTFRLLATLIEKGLVERDCTTGTYRLGENVITLGHKLIGSHNWSKYPKERPKTGLDGSQLLSVAYPIMEELARKHQEAVYLTVSINNEVLFLNMVDSDQPVRAEPLVGRRFPFFTNAAGKVMKAADSWDLLERICRRGDRRGKRPDLDQLASELQGIRATGVAVDDGGLGDGVISVTMPARLSAPSPCWGPLSGCWPPESRARSFPP